MPAQCEQPGNALPGSEFRGPERRPYAPGNRQCKEILDNLHLTLNIQISASRRCGGVSMQTTVVMNLEDIAPPARCIQGLRTTAAFPDESTSPTSCCILCYCATCLVVYSNAHDMSSQGVRLSGGREGERACAEASRRGAGRVGRTRDGGGPARRVPPFPASTGVAPGPRRGRRRGRGCRRRRRRVFRRSSP